MELDVHFILLSFLGLLHFQFEYLYSLFILENSVIISWNSLLLHVFPLWSSFGSSEDIHGGPLCLSGTPTMWSPGVPWGSALPSPRLLPAGETACFLHWVLWSSPSLPPSSLIRPGPLSHLWIYPSSRLLSVFSILLVWLRITDVLSLHWIWSLLLFSFSLLFCTIHEGNSMEIIEIKSPFPFAL